MSNVSPLITRLIELRSDECTQAALVVDSSTDELVNQALARAAALLELGRNREAQVWFVVLIVLLSNLQEQHEQAKAEACRMIEDLAGELDTTASGKGLLCRLERAALIGPSLTMDCLKQLRSAFEL